jgi:hypothetical protein
MGSGKLAVLVVALGIALGGIGAGLADRVGSENDGTAGGDNTVSVGGDDTDTDTGDTPAAG